MRSKKKVQNKRAGQEKNKRAGQGECLLSFFCVFVPFPSPGEFFVIFVFFLFFCFFPLPKREKNMLKRWEKSSLLLTWFSSFLAASFFHSFLRFQEVRALAFIVVELPGSRVVGNSSIDGTVTQVQG